jgi:hypothetical protein
MVIVSANSASLFRRRRDFFIDFLLKSRFRAVRHLFGLVFLAKQADV